MDLLPHIKFTRDDDGHRVYHGRRATYRVVDDNGPRWVEVHPAAGVSDDPARDTDADVVLVKLNECKAYIDFYEETGDSDAAWQLAQLAGKVKG